MRTGSPAGKLRPSAGGSPRSGTEQVASRETVSRDPGRTKTEPAPCEAGSQELQEIQSVLRSRGWATHSRVGSWFVRLRSLPGCSVSLPAAEYNQRRSMGRKIDSTRKGWGPCMQAAPDLPACISNGRSAGGTWRHTSLASSQTSCLTIRSPWPQRRRTAWPHGRPGCSTPLRRGTCLERSPSNVDL